MSSVQKIQQDYLKLNKSTKKILMCLAQTKLSAAESYRDDNKASPPKMFPGNMDITCIMTPEHG